METATAPCRVPDKRTAKKFSGYVITPEGDIYTLAEVFGSPEMMNAFLEEFGAHDSKYQ